MSAIFVKKVEIQPSSTASPSSSKFPLICDAVSAHTNIREKVLVTSLQDLCTEAEIVWTQNEGFEFE
jgi:hypothetical protein